MCKVCVREPDHDFQLAAGPEQTHASNMGEDTSVSPRKSSPRAWFEGGGGGSDGDGSGPAVSPHEESPAAKQEFKARAGFGCGLASGVIQAAVFNPYDRALYLTVR